MSYIIEEELEPLEDSDIEEKHDDGFQKEMEYVLSSSHNPFKTSIFPVLIINKKFKIVYANESCEQMFMGFTNLPGKYFFDLFGKAFDLNDARKIRDTVINGGNGFSWKGTAHLKTRDTVSVQIRVYIFPLEMDLKAPSDFVIMFDDFTE